VAKIQTDKQRKLIQLISENLGLAKPKTMMEMMLEAGYSEETAHQQSTILVGIREELDPIARKLEDHREKVIARMAVKLKSATYRDLTDSLDKTTKNIQLLRGKATENIAAKVVYLPERKDGPVDTDTTPAVGS
jgi:phage terminase small subunit